MLQILLKGKLSRYTTRSPFDIEDLLTSTVLGSCEYVSPNEALLPFIYKAIDNHGDTLGNRLQDIDGVEPYDFWGYCDAHDIRPKSTQGGDIGGTISVDASEPELILRFNCSDGKMKWIAVEVKLRSGKSSFANQDDTIISDQLAKYWCHLENDALRHNAEAIGVLYITANVNRPRQEIEEAVSELKKKLGVSPKIYWVSWRSFTKSVTEANQNPPKIIKDVITLLENRWQLTYEPMELWPYMTFCPSSTRIKILFNWTNTSLCQAG